MSKKLKPCPFCGMPVDSYEEGYVIHSPNKRGSGHGRIFMNIEAWNIRPIEDELQRRITELSWVSVSSKLPEDKSIVLAYCRNGEILKLRYYENKGWYSNYWRSFPFVTHWMPLPQPPEVAGCEDVHLDCKIAQQPEAKEVVAMLNARIAELEADNNRLKCSNDTQTDTVVYG